jgi:hypothetical protein
MPRRMRIGSFVYNPKKDMKGRVDFIGRENDVQVFYPEIQQSWWTKKDKLRLI